MTSKRAIIGRAGFQAKPEMTEFIVFSGRINKHDDVPICPDISHYENAFRTPSSMFKTSTR
ncbi:hypothetical protein [Nitrosospira multiformis]|jgi:hypothetical protein|uniref:hypothetical protein n=1 Tax=Nitrosospira multiformis TaxID=1231 RepID=UPI000D3001C7|nr:hypothetical protein [Nitrosospira multiformis]